MGLLLHTRELKKGSAEFLILSLIETRPRHGYDIAHLIEQRSGGALTFHAASLYPLLYKLEKRGWIEGRWVEKSGDGGSASTNSRRMAGQSSPPIAATGRHSFAP